MGELHTYRDAYGQTASIRDERRGRYPYRLKVHSPGGACSYNAIYATHRAARAALSGLGYCWTETVQNGAFARL